MNRTLIVQELGERTDKQNCMKIKCFYTTEEKVTRLKRQPTEWEKIFSSYTSDKGLITRIYKELKNLTSQRINDPLKKWAKELNR
jgi:hypothetical protein